MKKQEVVVLGGGTGPFNLLQGLKEYPINLTAICPSSDSGGSSGTLKDEFGILPPGDSRMALVALADSTEDTEILRRLFLHRFDKGSGLNGHNFGNLFILALIRELGSQERALEYASKLLHIRGRVLPVSDQSAQLVAEYEDGKIIKGETNIDEPDENHDGRIKIRKLSLEPDVEVASKPRQAILDSDAIVIAGSDLYTSVGPILITGGVKEAIAGSSAKIIYVLNLISKWGQTYGFTAKDHVEVIKNLIGRYPDSVLVNNAQFPEDVVKKYQLEKGYPVIDDLNGGLPFTVVRNDLLGSEIITTAAGDKLRRSLIRHDAEKTSKEIFKLLLG